MNKPLRSDAAYRRNAILKVATKEFAENGFDVPLEVIVEKAGVGRATLYRNFADRTELAIAVFSEQLNDLNRRTLERGDGADVFFWYLDRLAELMAQNAGLDAAMRDTRSVEALEGLRQKLIDGGIGPLERAKAAGLVRADLGPRDLRIMAILLGTSASRPDVGERQTFQDRVRSFILDGVKTRP